MFSVICAYMVHYCRSGYIKIMYNYIIVCTTRRITLLIYVGAMPCPFPEDLRCNTSQACIRYDHWCNSQINCDDGSDEDNCCKHYHNV